jgi:PGF-pre-PGF domain-containing protein
LDATIGVDCMPGLENGINYAINNGSSSVTFILNHTGDATDFYEWGSRESIYGDQPYLNISYNRDVSLTIDLDSPLNDAIEEPGNISFNWTTIGDESDYLCNLTLDGLVNVSNINAANNTITNTSILFIDETTYPWNVTCWNGNKSGTSETRNLVVATSYDDVVFNTSFEGANLINISYSSGNAEGYRHYTALMNYSADTGHTNYHFWYYFGMHNIINKTVQVDIINCLQTDEDNDRWDHVEAVYSFDNNITNAWNRMNSSADQTNYSFNYDSSNNDYIINITPGESSTIFIAPNYPYPYTSLQNYILSKNSNQYANVSVLGLTEGNRNINIIEITDTDYNNSEKFKVFIIAGQHVSGEEQGVWNSNGIIDFLLNETNPTANKIRQDYIFKIIPLVDPDSSAMGRGRYGYNWLDPNRQWNFPNPNNFLSINLTKNEIASFDPDLFIDLHGMISNSDNQLYYPSSSNNNEVGIMNNISSYWLETGSRVAQSTIGLASVAIDNEYDILSLTIETSISRTSSTGVRTKENWKADGKNIISGIYDYFGDANASFMAVTQTDPPIEENNRNLYKYTAHHSTINKNGEGIFNFKYNLAIRSINITAKEKIHFPKITVENLYTPHRMKRVPELIDGQVYSYEEITPLLFNDSHVKNIKINFRIKSIWLKKNNLSAGDIALKRYTSEWVDLDTKFIERKNNYHYFKSESPGFSYFAIGNKTKIITSPKKVDLPKQEEEIIELKEIEILEKFSFTRMCKNILNWITSNYNNLIKMDIIRGYFSTSK